MFSRMSGDPALDKEKLTDWEKIKASSRVGQKNNEKVTHGDTLPTIWGGCAQKQGHGQEALVPTLTRCVGKKQSVPKENL